MLALWAAIPIALLPATSRDVPADAVEQAEAAVLAAMPAPFEPARLDLGVVREHLAAAGPACRADPQCVCAAAPLQPGTQLFDLDVQRLSAAAWAADLRLLAPCEGRLLDRKAAVVEAGAPALSRFVAEEAAAMLRGRDLQPLRFTGSPRAAGAVERATAPPEPAAAPERAAAAPEGAAPAPEGAAAAPERTAAAPEPPVADSVRKAYEHALALMAQKAWVPAEAELTRVLDQSPAHAGAFTARGLARLDLAQTSAALRDFERAHQLEPAAGMPLFGLAEAHRILGVLHKALQFYRSSLATADLPADERGRASRWVRALEAPE